MKRNSLRFFVLLTFLSGCGSLTPPEEKVIYDMYDAMCTERSVEAMKPYLTEGSQKLLGIVKMGIMVGGKDEEVEIALQCQNSSVQITNKVMISDERYVMEIYPPNSNKMTKVQSVKENGEWKVSLGK